MLHAIDGGVMGASLDPLAELESKIAFLERTVDCLNDVVLKQQDQLDRVTAELKRLQETVKLAQESMPANEKPPHY